MNVMALLGKRIEDGMGPCGEAARAGGGMGGWVPRSVPCCVSCDTTVRVALWVGFGLGWLQGVSGRGWDGFGDGCAG